MDRRRFIQWGAAVAATAGGAGVSAFAETVGSGGSSGPSGPSGPSGSSGSETLPEPGGLSSRDGWKIYEVTTTVTLASSAAPARVWMPVTATRIGDYQRTLETRWDAPDATAGIDASPGGDVRMLAVDWSNIAGARESGSAGTTRLAAGSVTGSVAGSATGAATDRVLTAKLVNMVALREHAVDLSAAPSTHRRPESQDALRGYLAPTQWLPTDGIVRTYAQQITAGMTDDVTKARAIYEWVVDHTCREASVRGCGTGDVKAMLVADSRPGRLPNELMRGKCADINALFVALARSVGIPARDAYGVRVDTSTYGFHALGKAGDITGGQHCRAEFYASGYGWVPVDPADVRKVALEEVPGGLPMTDQKVHAARAMLFGKWDMNWVAYNHGHDVALPGSANAPVPFLMYPNGETVAGVIDSLDAKRFSYRIESRRIA